MSRRLGVFFVIHSHACLFWALCCVYACVCLTDVVHVSVDECAPKEKKKKEQQQKIPGALY